MLASILGSAKNDTSRSMTLFLVLMCFAAFAWLFAMIGLAGGWKRLSPYLPKEVSIGSVSGVVLFVVCGLLFVVYRQEVRSHPARAKLIAREAIRTPGKSVQTSNDPAPAPKQVKNLKKIEAEKVAPAAAKSSPQSVDQSPTAAPAGHLQNDTAAVTNPEEVVSNMPSPVRMTRERAVPEAAPGSRSYVASARAADELKPRQSSPAPELSAKRVGIIAHGAKSLSEPQSRQVCGAVSLFAGTQVYIKWSPGVNAGQLANQLSKAMDCARVTVTFASESGELEGHGVRVGTHVDEGETSDRIQPFADAITAALREQGFNVAEVSGANIPANQTAIFIGSD